MSASSAITSRLPSSPNPGSVLARADLARIDASRQTSRDERSTIGQFLTPEPTARFMASLLTLKGPHIRLLDPGAGVGALTAAAVERALGLSQSKRPTSLELVAYENDPNVIPYLERTHADCLAACQDEGVKAEAILLASDFIAAASSATGPVKFPEHIDPFNAAILNPPYGKIRRGSQTDGTLKHAGVDCTNLYSAFLMLAARLLEPGGELVAIVPRSFCNGPYFRAFRRDFLGCMTFTRVHVFDERGSTFSDDAVLQENIIFRAVKTTKRGKVTVSASSGTDDADMSIRTTSHDELVWPDDTDSFVRLLTDEIDAGISARMARLPCTLKDLGLTVSTGPVVDFRARDHLRDNAGKDTVPLIYPTNLQDGGVSWPVETSKPQAIVDCETTAAALIPNGTYVLVKRFSAKEERRRVVASVLRDLPGERLGLENHLNYFHRSRQPLGRIEAQGLAVYLCSSLVDQCFRQFNGHTQVNATDLRSLRYPSAADLKALGERARNGLGDQTRVDQMTEGVLFPMADDECGFDPVKAKQKVAEARDILKALGFPKPQHNERSGLVLLALTNLRAESSWDDAERPLMGITPMMTYMADHFGKKYAPNSRETVRRSTIHQFVEAGLALLNPDDPNRAVNSKDNVYQINPDALALIQTNGTKGWDKGLAAYRKKAGTLKKKYAKERKMAQITVRVAKGMTVDLTPGGQNVLVEQILHEFLPRFTPNAQVVYVGDTGKKWAYCDEDLMAELGITGIDPHGKFPDVVVHHEAEGWLVLIEAVTSHGPVDAKRHSELKVLFKGSKVGLVYVTAFMTKAVFVKYLRKIAWETEVWTADAPTHLIHFDGERFLGPYEEPPSK